MKRYLIILLLLFSSTFAIGDNLLSVNDVKSITQREIEAQVQFLSSDHLAGRAAGSTQAAITAHYISSIMYGCGYDVQRQEFYIDSIATKKGKQAVGHLTNILCTIKGIDSTKSVVVGAHYDHLGVTKQGDVFNGADDNASGVVAVLQIAQAFKKSGIRPLHNIVFAFWDGEEIGSLGSKHYLAQNSPHHPTIVSYMNFDMIGRNTDESRPTMFRYLYTQSSPQFEEWLKAAINDFKLDLDPDFLPWDNPTTGSDNAPFARQDIPIVWFHTDGHDDYHRVSDTAEKINYTKLTDIIRAAFVVVSKMAQ